MEKEIKLIFEDSNIINVKIGTTVGKVIEMLNNDQVIALRINGKIVSSETELTTDSYVNYITIASRIGRKIYMKGLTYVYLLAVKELYEDRASVYIKHSLDKSLYTEIKMKSQVDHSVVAQIKKKMKEIIKRDIPFRNISVDRNDAIEYSKSVEENEKVLNYTYMTKDSVTMCELGDMYNYFYYIMPASTKILKRFDLTYVSPCGVAISYPIDNVVPKFNPTPKVLEAFKKYEKKLSTLGVHYAGDINKIICDGNISDYIQKNEILYDENIREVAEKVSKDKNIKTIYISGPSSSGKTTTSKKLALYLNAKGYDTLVISTDDYFVDRKDTPRKPDGSYEYEIVEALDIKLFNSHIKSLLNGDEIIKPTYNFITGEKEYKGKPISLKENQILIVEGLHAINERLSSSIDKKNKLKVYISPFTPVGLDRHNHISTTDLRLLRRMVRDYKHRGYSATDTLGTWKGMRSSEEEYVYPYQREADMVINTSLSYEIGVLRTYAEPLLYSVDKNNDCYEEAIRILKFLDGFLAIPSEYVPYTSVLREFIGDSYFE